MSDLKSQSENKEGFWKGYDMASIDEAIPQVTQLDGDFVPLHIEGQEDITFSPYEGYENELGDGTQSEDAEKVSEESDEDQELTGYEKGFAQGEKDGYELGLQRGKKIVEHIENMLDTIARLKSDIIQQYEKDILKVIFAIAEKITHVQLETDHRIVKETIINAIHQATEKHTLILRINPEDFDFVEKLRPDLFEIFRTMKSITVNGDNAIQRGGCILETPSGDIDARIETQLENVSLCLRSVYSGNVNE